jgi:formyl-CoA transferase
LSGTPASIRTAAPRLGEHNRAILAELGVDGAAYAKLTAAGVAFEGDVPGKEEEK